MAFKKITEADLVNKGVIGLPDTPGMTTDEIQKKFDEIALDVIVPAHNALIDEIKNKGIAEEAIVENPVTGEDSSMQEALDSINKEVSDNTKEKHSHSNKSTLDKITEIILNNVSTLWGVFSGIERVITDVEDDDKSIPTSSAVHDSVSVLDKKIAENTSKRHEHSNKSVLDKLTQAILDKVAIFDKITSVSETATGGHETIPTSGAVIALLEDAGSGDMTKATYDADRDGVVDNASALGGVPAEDYAKKEHVKEVADEITIIDSALPFRIVIDDVAGTIDFIDR